VTIGEADPVQAVIDGRAQLNVLSAKLAKEQDLIVKPLPKIIPKSPNGVGYTVYEYTFTDVRIVNSKGREQTHQIAFVVADLSGPQVYLGLP
jgi:hypothetical protein